MSVDSNVTISETEKKAPETEKKAPETEIKTSTPPIENKEISSESVEQIHWKKFREQRDRERKERLALEEDTRKKNEEISALRQAVESLVNKPSPSSHQEYNEEDLSEEDRIKKQVDAAVSAALLAKDKETERQRQIREAQEIPDKLSSTFSDFQDVCTTENLDYLEFHYPEIADAFKNQPESFKKWSNIYKTVKRFIPNTKSGQEGKIAQRNMDKPQSMAVKGLTTTTDTAPVKFDDQRRADNWARMQRIMKGGS